MRSSIIEQNVYNPICTRNRAKFARQMPQLSMEWATKTSFMTPVEGFPTRGNICVLLSPGSLVEEISPLTHKGRFCFTRTCHWRLLLTDAKIRWC